MSKFGLRGNKSSVGLLAAAVAGLTALMPPAYADTTTSSPAAPRGAGSDNVTRSLRVVSPGVAVQAKPQSAKASTPAGTVPLREGQFAHLDQNGRLVPTPPPGVVMPPAQAAPPPVPQHSPKDPAALIFDTSNVKAVAIAHIGKDGKPAVDCVDNTLKPNADTEHSAAPNAVQPGDGQ